MLVDLSRAIGDYLHEVFVTQLDWWIVLGFIAQALFTARFVIQWLASERAGRSIIPFAFWVFSIGGGALLLIYAIHRRDPVFILGQALGLLIYFRNVSFVLKERKAARGEA
ncbi:MAG: lipid-A-disaccharide synthase N-terminal domain-containing protein [Labrys sp. (in: a-proteobacteria)]